MKDLTKEELKEQEQKLIEKREYQESLDRLMLVILFIIQCIVLTIMHVNDYLVVGNKLITSSLLINAGYYILKQLFYSEADTGDAIEFFFNISFRWLIGVMIVGAIITVITNWLEIDDLFDYSIVVIKTSIITLVTLLFIMFIDAFQSEIRADGKKLELTGYKQKAYELTENTKYSMGFIIFLAIIFALIILISQHNLLAINWEKPIIYLGIPFCIIILGILLRRD